MAIDLDRILTVSAKDYCESVDRQLRGYSLRGFSVTRGLSSETNPREELAKEIPENAEVVVNYRSNNLGEAFYEASGTALFRNETSEQIENRKLESTKDPKEEFKKILLEEIRK